MRNSMKKARERAAENKTFRESTWDGDEHPNSKLALAIALGVHPDRLQKIMKIRGCPGWHSGNRTGGYDLRAFQEFIAARKAFQ
jgi:hypothetical protein